MKNSSTLQKQINILHYNSIPCPLQKFAGSYLFFGMLLSFFLTSTYTIAQAKSTEQNSKTILFVDNSEILYYAGMERKLGELKKENTNPLIGSEDKAWEVLVSYNSIYKNSKTGKYQMWYQSYVGGQTPDKKLRCVVAYAESEDGIHWLKPELDIYPFYEVKKTNIVLLSNEGHSTHYGASVVVNENESDISKRYKMAYWDFVVRNGIEVPGMCIAFSPDGIHWKKYVNNPVLVGAYGDEEQPPFHTGNGIDEPAITSAISDVIDATYDPNIQKYVIFAKTWIDGPNGDMFWKRAVTRTESDDFIHWSVPQLMMWPDELDTKKYFTPLVTTNRQKLAKEKNKIKIGVQLHSGPAFYYNGIYFSLLQVLDYHLTGLMPTELAISRNGLDWERPFRDDYFIPVDGGKQFDSGTIWTNATPIIQKDEIWFYYGAYANWNLEEPEYDVKPGSGIGLAIMPLDRFASLNPMNQVGQVTLKPIELNNYNNLTVNADANSGTVKVEILDEKGYRVEGFTKDDCELISGDSIRHKVSWSKKSIADLPKGNYLIRIFSENAKLYAVTLN